MMRSGLIFTILFFLMVTALIAQPTISQNNLTNTLQINKNASLTIYTYESLLSIDQDSGYEFDEEFEKFAGLPSDSVEVVLLDDAGSILTKAVAEKNSPIADVLIGIDNVLVEKARQNDILTPYKPIGFANIREGLVDDLAIDFLLTPYDFGVISFWYLKDKITEELDPNTFVLNDLLEPQIAKQIIVENPTLSSPGLGFLLWTIAVFGDEDADIIGLVGGGWEDYWRNLSDNIRIVDSWGDALTLFYTEEANRPIMVSYATSPAYGSCLYNDTTTGALLSHENNEQWGWYQVEGIGLVKSAPHPELGKQFIDWFISDQLQERIHQNQWMYPAINGITPPDCYYAAIDINTILPLNEFIPRNKLVDNLDDWLDRWEVAIVEGTDNSIISISYFSLYYLVILVPILNKMKKPL